MKTQGYKFKKPLWYVCTNLGSFFFYMVFEMITKKNKTKKQQKKKQQLLFKVFNTTVWRS